MNVNSSRGSEERERKREREMDFPAQSSRLIDEKANKCRSHKSMIAQKIDFILSFSPSLVWTKATLM